MAELASMVPEDESVAPALVSVDPAEVSAELPPAPAVPPTPKRWLSACCGDPVPTWFWPKTAPKMPCSRGLACSACCIQLAMMSNITCLARCCMYFAGLSKNELSWLASRSRDSCAARSIWNLPAPSGLHLARSLRVQRLDVVRRDVLGRDLLVQILLNLLDALLILIGDLLLRRLPGRQQRACGLGLGLRDLAINVFRVLLLLALRSLLDRCLRVLVALPLRLVSPIKLGVSALQLRDAVLLTGCYARQASGHLIVGALADLRDLVGELLAALPRSAGCRSADKR